jgi:hypothetical protein
MNPGTGEPPAPQPQYERFDDEEAFQQAVERLLEQAGRELRIFDPDLSGLRLNLPDRISRLQRFLMASRTRRIYIAIHDTGYLAKYCPRMRDLMARYAHAVQVQQTDEEIRELQDAFFVLDANHYVRRPAAAVLARGDRGRRRIRGALDAGPFPGDLGSLVPAPFRRRPSACRRLLL